VITDPLLRGRVGYLRRVAADGGARVPAGVDGVLVSHVHHDHLDGPSLRRLGTATPVVAPAGAGRLLRRKGMRRVIELVPGERTRIAGITVEATPAEHEASRLPGRGRVPALGYVVGDGPRVYFAGDTDLFSGMAAIGDLGLDVALLPVTGWGGRTPPGHLDPQRAAEALRLLRHPHRRARPLGHARAGVVAATRSRGAARSRRRLQRSREIGRARRRGPDPAARGDARRRVGGPPLMPTTPRHTGTPHCGAHGTGGT